MVDFEFPLLFFVFSFHHVAVLFFFSGNVTLRHVRLILFTFSGFLRASQYAASPNHFFFPFCFLSASSLFQYFFSIPFPALVVFDSVASLDWNTSIGD